MFHPIYLTADELGLVRVWLLGERRRIAEDVAAFGRSAQLTSSLETRVQWEDVARITAEHGAALERVVQELVRAAEREPVERVTES